MLLAGPRSSPLGHSLPTVTANNSLVEAQGFKQEFEVHPLQINFPPLFGPLEANKCPPPSSEAHRAWPMGSLGRSEETARSPGALVPQPEVRVLPRQPSVSTALSLGVW